MSAHLLPLLALLLGHVCHVLARVVEQRADDRSTTMFSYIGNRPYRSALALSGSAAGYLLLMDTSQLTIVAAFGVGYLANDCLEVMGHAVKRKLEA